MRPSFVEVDPTAISRNVEVLRRLVAPAGLWAVVKADGYGHGAVTAARAELATATFADKKDDAAIKAAVGKVQAAELALANKRAAAFATLQGSAEKFNEAQVTAFIAAGGALPAAGRGGAGGGGGGGGRGAAAPAAGGAAPAMPAARGN